jgi:RNA polymerase sigma factor (sigma-70 family)
MANARLGGLLGRFAAALCDRTESDGELVTLYARHGSESAFASLLHRHGPMVLGVCRRLLGHRHDAEDVAQEVFLRVFRSLRRWDSSRPLKPWIMGIAVNRCRAFQATFLVLARKAASVRPPGRVGPWLYGVARRTALEARRAAEKRRRKEAMAGPRAASARDEAADGLREVIDAELARLPAAYSEVLVLCDLEGRGRREVAELLGCPEGTIASRLARAREALARRLTRHGLTSAAPLVAALPPEAVPATLASSTIQTALSFAAGAAGAVSARVAALAEGVIRAMGLHRVTKAAVVLLLALLAGAAVVASAGKEKPPAATADDAKEAKAPDKAEKKQDKELAKLQGTWVEKRSRMIWVISGTKITLVTRVSWMVSEGKFSEVDRGRASPANGTAADHRPRVFDPRAEQAPRRLRGGGKHPARLPG